MDTLNGILYQPDLYSVPRNKRQENTTDINGHN